MNYSRRDILKGGTSFAALGVLPRARTIRQGTAVLNGRVVPAPPIEDPDVKTLTDTSLNAAHAAGAAYADVRLTHSYQFERGVGRNNEEEYMNFGVRALVEGYWGFASGPIWSKDEAARLAKAAVRHAKANVIGMPRVIDLASVSPIADGHWVCPIRDDPFVMSRDELIDYVRSLGIFALRLPYVTGMSWHIVCFKQDKAYASTANQYFTQRIYRTALDFTFTLEKEGRKIPVYLSSLDPANVGFEYIRDRPMHDSIRKLHEENVGDLWLPLSPVEVGRYEAIVDAWTVARILSPSIGAATELDRALGYEANAGGTSYLNEPMDMVGSYKVGAPALTVTANRSEPGGLATVQWDDEGVPTHEFTLIDKGILRDMQTDREGAGWLKDVYAKQQRPITSHGCAHAAEASVVPLVHCSNLKMQAGGGPETFDSLIEGVKKGVAMKMGLVDMDFQQATGFGTGTMYEIRDGKRVALLQSAGFLFRTPEFWNSIQSVGSTASQQRFGLRDDKGEPVQQSFHSVTSCPVAVKELTVIDRRR